MLSAPGSLSLGPSRRPSAGRSPSVGEVATRDPGALADGGLVAKRDAGAEDPVARDSGQRRLRPLEVTEHRVAPDDPVPTPRLVAGVVSLDRPGEIQVDQLVRSGHRKRPEQDLLEERVDRCIRADAQRERENGNRVDEGRRAEVANGIPEVAHLPWGDGFHTGTRAARPGFEPFAPHKPTARAEGSPRGAVFDTKRRGDTGRAHRHDHRPSTMPSAPTATQERDYCEPSRDKRRGSPALLHRLHCLNCGIGALERVVVEHRLSHHAPIPNDVFHRALEVPLMYALSDVRPRLGRGRSRRLQYRVLDVAAAHREPLGERAEVHVVGERRFRRMQLHLPDALALLDARHLEEDVSADASLERGVEVGREVRGEDDDAVEVLELAEEHVDGSVRLALEPVARAPETTRGDGVRFVEQQHGVLLDRRAKEARDVLRGLTRPHRVDFGVVDEEQLLTERVRDRLRADGFARAGWPSKVEREAKPGRVSLAEPPVAEDEPVVADLAQRLIERFASPRRKNDVGERSLRNDRFDGASPGEAP